MTHPVDRAFENRDVRAKADRDHRGVVTDDPSAEDDDTARCNSGYAPEQQPAPTEGLLEEVRTCLRGEATGDLAHRCEQR